MQKWIWGLSSTWWWRKGKYCCWNILSICRYGCHKITWIGYWILDSSVYALSYNRILLTKWSNRDWRDSSTEYLLLLQNRQIWFPEPTWRLTTLLLQIQEFWCLLDSAGTCMNTVSDVIIVMKGRPDWKQVLLSSQESCQITCAPCHPGKHWDIVRTWKCCTYFALKNHWEILNNNHIVAIHHKKIPRLFSMIALFYELFCLHFQLYQAV